MSSFSEPKSKKGDLPLVATSFGGLEEATYFTAHLLAASLPKSLHADNFDPNHVRCEGCEDIEAQVYCKDCRQFFCVECQAAHKRFRIIAAHEFASIEAGLSLCEKESSSADRITQCQRHPRQEINAYCEKCEEACCPECVVDLHSHGVARLAELSPRFTADLANELSKVFPFRFSPSLPFFFNCFQLFNFFLISRRGTAMANFLKPSQRSPMPH